MHEQPCYTVIAVFIICMMPAVAFGAEGSGSTGKLPIVKYDYPIGEATRVVRTYQMLTADMDVIGEPDKETWYVADSSITLNSRLKVLGTVNLILCDGVTVNASKGIGVYKDNRASFTVYGQYLQSGVLYAEGPEDQQQDRHYNGESKIAE